MSCKFDILRNFYKELRSLVCVNTMYKWKTQKTNLINICESNKLTLKKYLNWKELLESQFNKDF